MKETCLKKNLLMTILAIFVFFLPTSILAQETIKWKIQSYTSPTETSFKTLDSFCKNVKIMTNGRLEIKLLPPGAIVPTMEMLDAVSANVLQGMYTAAGYYSGKNVAFGLLTDPIFAYAEPWEHASWWLYRGGMELANELWEPFGVKSIGFNMIGRECLPTNTLIKKMEDFKSCLEFHIFK